MLGLHEFLTPGHPALHGSILGHARSSDPSYLDPTHEYRFFPTAATMLVWHGEGTLERSDHTWLDVRAARLVVMRPGPHMTPCPTSQGSLVTLLRAGTLRRLTGTWARDLPPREVALQDLGVEVSWLEEAMALARGARARADVLESWMCDQLARTKLGPSPCRRLHRELSMRALPTAAQLARDSGLSARQLRRHFLADVGIAPKRYLRLLRLRAALPWALTPKAPDWAALDLGFYDQSHLIHEFRDFLGHTPEGVRALFARSSPMLDGIAVPR